MAMTDRPDPAQLAQAVKGMSDEEVGRVVRELGIDTVLKEIFAGMEEHFLPEKAAGINDTIQYEIATEEGTKVWSVAFRDGTCTTSEGPAESPRLTLQVGLVDFVRLIFGQAKGPQLFMSGKLRLRGDMMFAMQMQGFFKRDF